MKKIILLLFLFIGLLTYSQEFRFGNSPGTDDQKVTTFEMSGPNLNLQIEEDVLKQIDIVAGLDAHFGSTDWRTGGGGGSDGLGTARNVGAFTVVDEDNATLNSGIDATLIADGSVTNQKFQYISSLANDAQQQIDSKLNITGGTVTGDINFQGVAKAVGLQDPVNPQDAVTLSFLNGQLNDNWITGQSVSRTNEYLPSNIIAQPWEDSQSDGPAPGGTIILEFNVPPAFISTGTTLDMDDYRGYNTGVSGSTSYTLDVPIAGGFIYAFVNAASEPTFDGSGVGVTIINPVGSLDFIPNDNMLSIIWMLTDTTAMQWWIDIP